MSAGWQTTNAKQENGNAVCTVREIGASQCLPRRYSSPTSARSEHLTSIVHFEKQNVRKFPELDFAVNDFAGRSKTQPLLCIADVAFKTTDVNVWVYCQPCDMADCEFQLSTG